MNVLDWCLLALVGDLCPLGLLAGLHHRGVRDRRPAARRPARHLGRAPRARRRGAVAVGLARRALHRDRLGVAGAGALPVRRRAHPGDASPGSRSGPSTRSAARRSAPSRCCSWRGRSASPSPAPASAGSPRSCATPPSSPRSNATLPADSRQVLQAFNNVVGTTFFPRYLEPFAPERIVAVKPGDRRMLTDPDVVVAQSSVVKVRGANGCGSGVEGTGFFYAPGRLMTNAHVVAGVTRPEVEVAGSTVVASVVLYDADLDIAVLALPDTGVPHLTLDTEAAARRQRRGARLPRGRARTTSRPAGSARSSGCARPTSTARAPSSGRSTRCARSSGPATPAVRSSPPAGDVAGMVFAASVSDQDTGYALTAEPGRRVRGRGAHPRVAGRHRHLRALTGRRISPCP